MTSAKEIGKTIKRLPGQALREERLNLFDREIVEPLVIAFAGWVCLVLECLHVFGRIEPSVWIGVAVMLISTLYAMKKYFRGRRKLRNYRRGEEGERIVAQAIEESLLPRGYAVFHDIQLSNEGKRFNIDHLIVGENGIFAVETKYYQKPATGKSEVTYDGKVLLWNGAPHKRDEIVQATRAAQSAKTLIEESTGLTVSVRPVLCAVGWFVKSTALYGNPVLLVMEKTIGTVIPKVEATSLISESDRKMIIAALKRSVNQ